MRVSRLTDFDVELVVRLWERCGLTRPWNDPFEDITHALQTSSSTVLVGREVSTIVATVMVGFDGHRGWIYYLAVDLDFQNCGYGTTMMAAAEEWLRERNVPKLHLMVRDTNAESLGFYERLGSERQFVTTLGKRLDERT